MSRWVSCGLPTEGVVSDVLRKALITDSAKSVPLAERDLSKVVMPQKGPSGRLQPIAALCGHAHTDVPFTMGWLKYLACPSLAPLVRVAAAATAVTHAPPDQGKWVHFFEKCS